MSDNARPFEEDASSVEDLLAPCQDPKTVPIGDSYVVPVSWRTVKRGCGNVAAALLAVGWGLIVVLMWGPTSRLLIEFLLYYVFAISVISALLALVGGRFWVVIGDVALYLVLGAFAPMG